MISAFAKYHSWSCLHIFLNVEICIAYCMILLFKWIFENRLLRFHRCIIFRFVCFFIWIIFLLSSLSFLGFQLIKILNNLLDFLFVFIKLCRNRSYSLKWRLNTSKNRKLLYVRLFNHNYLPLVIISFLFHRTYILLLLLWVLFI